MGAASLVVSAAGDALPRTADGKPDLQGYWDGSAGTKTVNIQVRPKTATNAGTKSLVTDPPDGRIPYQPWAAEKQQELGKYYRIANENAKFEPVTVLDPRIHCLPTGVPRTVYDNDGFQIVQTSRYIAVFSEYLHAYRVIRMDGRPHLDGKIRLWMGDSRGHWEGDTLVVDVTNANGKAWFDMAGDFQSVRTHIVERFTLVDAETIQYEATVTDPTLYARPWTLAFSIARRKQKDYELLEHACYEGERDKEHLLVDK